MATCFLRNNDMPPSTLQTNTTSRRSDSVQHAPLAKHGFGYIQAQSNLAEHGEDSSRVSVFFISP